MSVFSSMADKGKSPVPTDVPSQQVVDQGFGKLTLSDIIEDIDKLQNTFGNIREKLQFLKEICEQMSFGSDNFKLTHKHTNKIEGKFGDGISLLRDRREKLNKVERVTAPLSNTDEKGDEHVSDHSIPPIPMDIGDSGNREVQQEDKMDADQASADSDTPCSDDQGTPISETEATTAPQNNTENGQQMPAESNVENQPAENRSTEGELVPADPMSAKQQNDLFLFKIGLSWQTVENNLRPFFFALRDIDSGYKKLENAKFPGLIRTIVNKIGDFDADDFMSFEPMNFIQRERTRILQMNSHMNLMFYDILETYHEDGEFPESVKELLFFLSNDDRRGSCRLAKNKIDDRDILCEGDAQFGGYERILYEAIKKWRVDIWKSSLENYIRQHEPKMEENPTEENNEIVPEYKTSEFFVKRLEYLEEASSLDSMEEKTTRLLMKTWAYQALKEFAGSKYLDRLFNYLNQVDGPQFDVVELNVVTELFSVSCDGRLNF